MKAIHLIAALSLMACAAPQVTQKSEVWSSFGYEGFGAKIERLAGAQAVHCGVVNLVNKKDPSNSGASVKLGRECIKKSIADGKPFKYGTVSIPIDSYLFEALIFTPEREYWIVHYDVMLDGTHNLHVIKRCKGIDLARSVSAFEAVDCKAVSTEEWLADIPEQKS